MPLFTLDNVTLGKGRQRRLCDVCVTIESGVTAVLGASGAGKTSLLNLLVGFERPTRATRRGLQSSITPNGHATPIYWVPHDGGLWPHLTARQHLEFVASPASGGDAAITHWLAAFDLLDRAAALPATLSQGERQRLAVARCLAAAPAVAIMDEPLAHVDPARLPRYWQAIREHLAADDASLIFATHDPETALAEAEHAICMDAGRVTYAGPIATLYHAPPTPQLAATLGPFNWFPPTERPTWLTNPKHKTRDNDPTRDTGHGTRDNNPTRDTGHGTRDNPCIRPEQLDVAPDPASLLIVRQARFRGAYGELHLEHEMTHETRRIVHRPAGREFSPGDRVLLQVVRLFIVMLGLTGLLAGCEPADDPVLAVHDVEYWTLPVAGVRLPSPRSVAFGPGDEMLVLDTAGRVLVYGPSGKLIRQWEMPEYDRGRPEGACYMRDGRIAVADTHYYRVLFFDRDGNVVGQFGTQGEGPGQFIYPVSVVQDDAGNLYVAEYGGNDRVQKFTAEGEYIQTIGAYGLAAGQFTRPQCIMWCRPDAAAAPQLASLEAGALFVVDVEKGCVQVFSGDGEYLGLFGEGWLDAVGSGGLALDDPRVARFGLPYGIAIGHDQSIYTIEYQNARVSKFTFDGRLLGRFGSPGTDRNQFLTPWAMNVDSQNRIRVADTKNNRIVAMEQ